MRRCCCFLLFTFGWEGRGRGISNLSNPTLRAPLKPTLLDYESWISFHRALEKRLSRTFKPVASGNLRASALSGVVNVRRFNLTPEYLHCTHFQYNFNYKQFRPFLVMWSVRQKHARIKSATLNPRDGFKVAAFVLFLQTTSKLCVRLEGGRSGTRFSRTSALGALFHYIPIHLIFPTP